MLSGLFVPDTWDYMVAGYIVFTVMIGLYVGSITLRWRKAKREFEDLQ